MKHFRQEEWADFARGLAGERKTAMQEHLKSCEQCGQSLQIWQQVTKMAAQEAAYEPPADAVRIAKSYGAALAPQGKRSMVARVAELLQDTGMEPALAGIRSSTTAAPRQLLYRSGEFNIDLRIERGASPARTLLVGQILSTTGRSVRSIPVALISGLGPVASGVTSEFGEFQLEMEAGLKVQLLVWLYGSTNIMVPLDVLVAEELDKPRDNRGLRGSR